MRRKILYRVKNPTNKAKFTFSTKRRALAFAKKYRYGKVKRLKKPTFAERNFYFFR